jgi:hypothetical protein
MDGKLILGFLNYLFISLIFVFGLISLLVRDQRKKLTFLFLALLSAGVLSFLFFAGMAFILPGIILIFFYLLLNIFIASQEFYGFGKPSVLSDKNLRQDKQATQSRQGLGIKQPSLVINFLLSLAVSAGAGVIFFIYNKDFLKGLKLVESFKAAATGDIINNIGANYIPAILVISAALFSSVFWFISILENRRAKK